MSEAPREEIPDEIREAIPDEHRWAESAFEPARRRRVRVSAARSFPATLFSLAVVVATAAAVVWFFLDWR